VADEHEKLENVLPSPPTHGKKRTAEEMMEAPQTPVMKQVPVGEEAVKTLPTPDDSPSTTPETKRPAKRLRKVANVVGLAALGGIAGSLALFTSLVASGPTFV
jgi:hypothetical protein